MEGDRLEGGSQLLEIKHAHEKLELAYHETQVHLLISMSACNTSYLRAHPSLMVQASSFDKSNMLPSNAIYHLDDICTPSMSWYMKRKLTLSVTLKPLRFSFLFCDVACLVLAYSQVSFEDSDEHPLLPQLTARFWCPYFRLTEFHYSICFV